jgi:glutathione S-transferase
MLTFYFAPRSSSMAVRIALHEVGASFESRPLSFARREQRHPGNRLCLGFRAAATLHPARRQGAEHANAVFAIADRRLGAREWVLGHYSIADIHLFRLYWRFANSLKPAAGALTNLAIHHDRMMARPAVRRTIEIEAAIGYELPA